MKRIALLTTLIACLSTSLFAQKFALVDLEYILNHIPAYESSSQQLEQSSKKWQKEIDALNAEAKTLYKNYQAEMVFLSDDQKKEKEQAVIAKETEASELKQKYFGNNGELIKKRQSLMKPIQDEIYNAVKDVSKKKGIHLILDRASGNNIIFADPAIDLSDDVLTKMGYKK